MPGIDKGVCLTFEFRVLFIEESCMTKTIADVMKLVKDKECTFVDFRFVDIKGKEQHTTVPISAFDEDKFESGHAFDGSSIAGWKGIEAFDMLLMPDPTAAYIAHSMKNQPWFLPVM